MNHGKTLDRDALWKLAEEMAQNDIDSMYPEEQEGIRAAKFEEFRAMYFRQFVTPPSKS